MTSSNTLMLNTLENSAVSVCRNVSVMSENNTVISYKDASFGVSFFYIFRFFRFCFYYFYYFVLYFKNSTAKRKISEVYP